MRNLTTIVLGAASLLLALVIAAVEKAPDSNPGTRVSLIRFSEDDLETITLRQGEIEVVMKQQQGHWYFTSPQADRINSNAMASLLDLLNNLTILDQFKNRELTGEMSLENLGLNDSEALQVIFQTNKKGKQQSETLLLGRPAPRANSVFARLGGKRPGEVVVVNGNPHELLSNPFDTLRERRFVGAPAQGLVQVAIKTGETEMAVQRRLAGGVTPWELIAPISANADQEKVENLIDAIMKLQITEVESTEVTPIPEKLTEDSAVIQLAVVGVEKPIVMYLEKKKNPEDDFAPPYISARISDRPLQYRLDNLFFDSLPEDHTSLRDRRLGSIPEKALQSIVIFEKENGKAPAPEVILEANRNAQGVAWRVVGPGFDANYQKISELIKRMNEPVIISFIPAGAKLSDYGMGQSSFGVGFNFLIPGEVKEDGSVAPDETFAKTLQLGWKKDGETPRLFGNFVGDPYIYELDPGFANLLSDHPVEWRSLNVTRISRFHVSEISQSVRGRENITLTYEKMRNRWTGKRGEVDVSPYIDQSSARGLRDRLSSLRAKGWILQAGEAYRALADPFATFTIKYSVLDRAVNQRTEETTTIRFAESSVRNIIWGQVEGNPDVFFISKELFSSLIRPVTGTTMQEVR